MGLLAAVRTDWSADPRPMATERAPAARVDRIRLRALSLGATLELLATRTAFSQVDRCCCRYTTSRGNPLFALELAAGAHANSLPGLLDTVRMPDSLRRLVLERVTLLPPGSRDVLLVRSLSTETALPAICAAASNPATAYTDLEVGIRAGLLTVADGDVAFVHPPMRSVVGPLTADWPPRCVARRHEPAISPSGPKARTRRSRASSRMRPARQPTAEPATRQLNLPNWPSPCRR